MASIARERLPVDAAWQATAKTSGQGRNPLNMPKTNPARTRRSLPSAARQDPRAPPGSPPAVPLRSPQRRSPRRRRMVPATADRSDSILRSGKLLWISCPISSKSAPMKTYVEIRPRLQASRRERDRQSAPWRRPVPPILHTWPRSAGSRQGPPGK